jgi:hypothetical protein
MHKLVAVAALCVAGFAVPVLPTQAAPMMSAAESDCLIFPMFKKECWEMGAEKAMDVPKAAASATMAAGDAANDAARGMKVPTLWTCAAAPAGSGHLLDC